MAGAQYFKPLRQVIESVNDTLKCQFDLEQHGGRTIDGVSVRVLLRILALTAAIWHNDATASRHALANRLRPLTLGIDHRSLTGNGSCTRAMKKSSICRMAAMNCSKSTGLVTYALACSL